SQAMTDARDAARDEREAGTLERAATTFARAEIAGERFASAARRDREAEIRDLTAKARDLAAEALDRAAAEKAGRQDEMVSPRDRRMHRAARNYDNLLGESGNEARVRAAADRAHAAEDRARAAEDRAKAAEDRDQARLALEKAHLDELTGAYQRGIGLVVLQLEIERARRSSGRLVLAYVDVDGLKRVNDREGHACGDALLKTVATTIRSKMRSYEPIVRFGGDEFVCAFAEIDDDVAAARFEEIQSSLNAGQSGAAISVGFAALEPGDSLEDLIARADDALIRTRGGRDSQVP
ncbi:MAG: GGDEF domain-containing protein, partial [Actinomycetota bacterium]|nr:GGDEF domain-containing protein [Actinomycetota bacterium]